MFEFHLCEGSLRYKTRLYNRNELNVHKIRIINFFILRVQTVLIPL